MKLCLLAIGFALLLSIDEGESGRCRLMMRPYCRYACDGCSLSCGFRFSMITVVYPIRNGHFKMADCKSSKR